MMGASKRILSLLVVLLSGASAFSDPAPEKIDFRRDVVPILEARCFACHRGAAATASYRLDLRAELLGETTGKPLVKLGSSGDSRLIHAVTGKAAGKLMPRKGPPLTGREIGILRAWIDQGLAWDDHLFPAALKSDHWAFQPINVPPIPKVRIPAWVRTPIDAFIVAKHVEKGLSASLASYPSTLIRRLHLDLTGLPPSPDEVDQFETAWHETSAKPQAVRSQIGVWQRVVDQLLASPHYGERWGRHWLDVARWAESEGYESNHPRSFAWRYRDWVVQSFNRDLPFADFLS